MKWGQKPPKLKKGAWFYKVRGSYLPATPQGWWLHALLILSCFCVIFIATNDTRKVAIVAITSVLELIGVGAIFTWIASRKS